MYSFRNWMKSLGQYLRKVILKLWDYLWNVIREEGCCVLIVQEPNLFLDRRNNDVMLVLSHC